MVKKWYYGNEFFGLVWDRIKVRQVGLFITTTQHSLLTMFEKWKSGIDNGAYVSVLFMDLSKAFDTINHDLMLAKLKAYGFSTNALNLMHSYLKNRKQKVENNNKFSLERNVIAGVLQGTCGINDLVFFYQLPLH